MTTVDIDYLKALLDLLEQRDVAEFESESDGTRIHVVRQHAAPTGGATYSMAPPMMNYGGGFAGGAAGFAGGPGGGAGAGGGGGAEKAPEPEPTDVFDVTCPFVGTFYRAPTPDTPSFVEVGAVVRTGQTLCIVEAMKLMNEIEAEVSGTIIEIYAANGKSVEFGQKLFRIKKA